MAAIDTNDAAWRLRPFLLAGIGALAALIVHHLFDTVAPPPAWRTALGCGLAVATFAFGFSLERRRIGWVIGFAAALGLVAGLILYWNDVPQMGTWGDWRYASLLLAIVVPVPLFQVAHARGSWRFPYDEVHAAAWTNVVLWCACWAFAGIAFALAWLLAGLFGLIGLHFLRDLLHHGWANALLFGAAFGGALGLLRERAGIVLLLQRVVTAVLGVLAPVLAVGLVLFLCALPFTGLGALWEATKATTPILLACVIGALILANAVIGNGLDEEASSPVLRYGAMALAVAMLPLTGIAALATGLRIQQYGYSPDRLWALVFVILASVYAVAYLGSVVRGRRGWSGFARDANLKLAFVVAGVALVLATPLLSFNAISTRDQVARLESGRVSPDKFDWAALAFDFGDPGKAAVKRLVASGNATIAAHAKIALSKTSRYDLLDVASDVKSVDRLSLRLRVVPAGTAVPVDLRRLLVGWSACGTNQEQRCTIWFAPGGDDAVALRATCLDALSELNAIKRDGMLIANDTCNPARYRRILGVWRMTEGNRRTMNDAALQATRAALSSGRIDVRQVPARQLFVGGVPVGDPFE